VKWNCSYSVRRRTFFSARLSYNVDVHLPTYEAVIPAFAWFGRQAERWKRSGMSERRIPWKTQPSTQYYSPFHCVLICQPPSAFHRGGILRPHGKPSRRSACLPKQAKAGMTVALGERSVKRLLLNFAFRFKLSIKEAVSCLLKAVSSHGVPSVAAL
jgi:hypothetical protein